MASIGRSAQARSGEDELIARYFAPLAGEGGLGLEDDAALLRPPPGQDLVLTVDALVAGVHFFADDPPAAIGRKALAVNLSDLAAKGAAPEGFLLTLALADDWEEAWLAAFAGGLGEAAQLAACPLLGGDTVRAAGPLAVSITAIGSVPAGRMVRRGAARPGDRLVVTGTIGDAALGLLLRQGRSAPWASALRPDDRFHLLDRYLHPRPRLAAAAILRDHARAAMDVSDGLAGDLAKMMRASRTTARVEAAQVPLSPAARAAVAAQGGLMDCVLTGGDDYEILCAVPGERVEPCLGALRAAGVPAAVIGEVEEGTEPPAFRLDGAERRFARGSFSHF